ncbi:MAG: 50S ribosomal protein L25 [Chloroflexi bacterium]|nr:50S ribosomal protein L25 [Chloroflexota bacterium]
MTTQTAPFQVEPRSTFGKKLKALRRSGVAPVHLYGKGAASLSLQVETRRLERLVATTSPNTPVYVSVVGSPETHFAFLRDVQRHPVSDALLHVDFYQVSLTEAMEAEVPVRLVGEAPAVRALSGVLFQALQTLTVECLPLDIPQYVEVDVSGLTDFERSVTVKDIRVSAVVKVLTSPDAMVARVNPPRAELEEEGAAPVAAEPEASAPGRAAEEQTA